MPTNVTKSGLQETKNRLQAGLPITIKAACEWLGVSRATLRNMTRDGRLEKISVGEYSRRVRSGTLNLLKSCMDAEKCPQNAST